MDVPICLKGIYDINTVRSAADNYVQCFGFDFRAKSFNFLQQYKFLELITTVFSPLSKYILQYANEKDYVIWKMIDDLKSELSKLSDFDKISKYFYLEFSDMQTSQFYDQFQLPFIWHYDTNQFINQIQYSEYLSGVVLDYQYLQELHDNGQFYYFINDFIKQTQNIVDRKNIDLILSIDWDSDIFPSLFEHLNVNCLSLSINNKIEISFRNVNLAVMEEQLKYFTNHISLR